MTADQGYHLVLQTLNDTYEFWGFLRTVFRQLSFNHVGNSKSIIVSVLLVAFNGCLFTGQSLAESDTSTATSISLKDSLSVLEFVDIPSHVIRGEWSKRNNELVCEKAEHALVLLPIAVEGNYEINCEFTRRTGGGSVNVICPMGESSGVISINGWEGLASGMGMVDEKIGPKLDVKTGAVIKPGKIKSGTRYHLKVIVGHTSRVTAVKAWLNGQQFVDWKGADEQIGNLTETLIPCWESFGLCVTKGSVVDFHRFEFKLLKGEGYQLGERFENPLSKRLSVPPDELIDACGEFKGRYYYISAEPVTLLQAMTMANKAGGRLLTISSEEEDQFIFEAGRGIAIWMSGWRKPGSNEWQDERNIPLKYFGKWAPNQRREKRFFENQLGIHTTKKRDRGWHNHMIFDKLHVCIEWGEEDTQ